MSAEEFDGQPFSPLVGAVLTQMNADRAFTTNALIDSYKQMLADRDAELYAIRVAIGELLDHPWTPSSEAIREAVTYPSRALIEQYHANKEMTW